MEMRQQLFVFTGASGLPVCLHVSVTELGQGQKAAALIEMVRHQNKEMYKDAIMITCKGLVFLNNVAKLLFITFFPPRSHTLVDTHMHMHTAILPHFHLYTYPFLSRKTNREVNE